MTKLQTAQDLHGQIYVLLHEIGHKIDTETTNVNQLAQIAELLRGAAAISGESAL